MSDPSIESAAQEPPSLLRAADILARVADAFLVLDRDWRIVYANREACRINQKPLEEFVGRTHWEEWPASVGTEVERRYRRAMDAQEEAHFEHRYVSGPYDVWLEFDAYPAPDGLNVFYRDITARKRAEEVSRQRMDLLALSAEVGRALITHDTLADMLRGCAEALVEHLDAAFARVWTLDETGEILVLRASAGLYTHLDGPHGRVPVGRFKIGLIAEERRPHLTNAVVGDPRVSDQEWARREGMTAFAGYPLLVEDRLVGVVALFARRSLSEVTIHTLGAVADQVAVGIERIQAAEALRRANLHAAGILESITDAFFALDSQWRFTYLNDQAERLLFRAREELLGRSLWDKFPEAVGSAFERQYRRAAAQQIVVEFDAFYPPLSTWFEVRAYPSADGLSVYFHDISARKEAQDERERLLAEQRARAEREALLNRIGQALRSSLDPEAVQGAAVALLGEALGADRCYLGIYDLGGGVVTLARDWRRAGLPSIQGVYSFVNTADMFRELYRNSNTSVIQDAYTAALSAQTLANMESLGLRSRVSVALVDAGGLMATLTAAMADGPRAWTDDEVALVEAVATQLRTAVEMARIARREHAISTQLQKALQPELPGAVPGLALANYYRPALAENEGVGGDFFDVFAIEKGCTALVVGDLSGKGLAAAAQVATVRNMLRAFLYSLPTVAEAVTSLNRVLAENNLLTGFTTLFVGAYDSATGVLKYINCGQEPALVRRAGAGVIEMLEATGPILGAIEGARYAESRTVLAPGDAVAVFTDGLTEVGPRTKMLGIEGVADLLAGAAAEAAESAEFRAERLTLRLIEGVDGFAQTGVRDDMCLLVGVVL